MNYYLELKKLYPEPKYRVAYYGSSIRVYRKNINGNEVDVCKFRHRFESKSEFISVVLTRLSRDNILLPWEVVSITEKIAYRISGNPILTIKAVLGGYNYNECILKGIPIFDFENKSSRDLKNYLNTFSTKRMQKNISNKKNKVLFKILQIMCKYQSETTNTEVNEIWKDKL